MTILGSIDIIMGEVDRWNDNWFNRNTRYTFFFSDCNFWKRYTCEISLTVLVKHKHKVLIASKILK